MSCAGRSLRLLRRTLRRGVRLLPDGGDKVMHAVLRVGETTLLASDFGAQAPTSAYALSLQVADDAEARRVFAALAEDGAVQQPLIATPFASSYGRLADRFGVPWIIVTATPAQA